MVHKHITIVILSFILFAMVIIAQPPFSVDSNTMALWRFDQIHNDSIYDESGHGNHLQICGSAKLSQGLFNNAINFDGNNSFLICRPQQSITYNNGLSIDIFYKPQGMQDNLLEIAPTCMIYTDYIFLTCSDSLNYNTLYINSAQQNLAKWNYLKVVFNNDSSYFFFNNNDRISIKNIPLRDNKIDSIYIAGFIESPFYFQGLIDEIKISFFNADDLNIPYKYHNTWTKSMITGKREWGHHGIVLKNGEYIVIGGRLVNSNSNLDLLIVKLDRYGDTIWSKTYGGIGRECANWVQSTIDSGYIITGLTTTSGSGGSDIWVLKTDWLGDTIWTKTIGNTTNDEGFCVLQKKGGGYIVSSVVERCTTGVSSSMIYENGDLLITSLNENGSTDWQQRYNFPQYENRDIELGSMPFGNSLYGFGFIVIPAQAGIQF